MKRQVRQSERQHPRLRRHRDCEPGDDGERQRDRDASREQSAADESKIARAHETERTDRQPDRNRDDDQV